MIGPESDVNRHTKKRQNLLEDMPSGKRARVGADTTTTQGPVAVLYVLGIDDEAPQSSVLSHVGKRS